LTPEEQTQLAAAFPPFLRRGRALAMLKERFGLTEHSARKVLNDRRTWHMAGGERKRYYLRDRMLESCTPNESTQNNTTKTNQVYE